MGCSCCRCCCCCTLVLILIVAGSLGLLTALFPYPSHASCQATWTFGKDCSTVQDTLVEQIKEWSHEDCSSKQQCRYDFLGYDGNVIRGTHTTPLLKYVDTFNFTFTDTDFGCKAVGYSRSDAWYAVLDFGVNYCNLKNLIMGSMMYVEDNYYTEDTINANCTMYSVAHCNFYS